MVYIEKNAERQGYRIIDSLSTALVSSRVRKMLKYVNATMLQEKRSFRLNCINERREDR